MVGGGEKGSGEDRMLKYFKIYSLSKILVEEALS